MISERDAKGYKTRCLRQKMAIEVRRCKIFNGYCHNNVLTGYLDSAADRWSGRRSNHPAKTTKKEAASSTVTLYSRRLLEPSNNKTALINTCQKRSKETLPVRHTQGNKMCWKQPSTNSQQTGHYVSRKAKWSRLWKKECEV